MKKIFILICWLMPMYAVAQQNNGIVFQNFDNWQQLLDKAKAEHKNIFIDAYATWCGPCKKMDAEVYTNANIGSLINTNFIAVKVQFDQQKNDNDQTKKWYADAEYLQKTFHIDAFPTFLFLTPDGDLIYKDMGYQDVAQFTYLINKVDDPKSNYTYQIAQFKSGRLKKEELLSLALKAKRYQDSTAIEIAEQYKISVLEVGNLSKLLCEETRDFITEFQKLFTLNDKSISYMEHNEQKADRLFNQKGFSRNFINYLITKNIINPIVKPHGKYAEKIPDWKALEKEIKTTYGTAIANKLIMATKSGWYMSQKDWPNAVKYAIRNLDNNGVDTSIWAAIGINNMVFGVIFMHSDDPVYIKKGIGFMEILLKAHPDRHSWIDTYANLLYKLGKKHEAIEHEERAFAIVRDLNDTDHMNEYQEVIKKMKSSLPTWE